MLLETGIDAADGDGAEGTGSRATPERVSVVLGPVPKLLDMWVTLGDLRRCLFLRLRLLGNGS